MSMEEKRRGGSFKKPSGVLAISWTQGIFLVNNAGMCCCCLCTYTCIMFFHLLVVNRGYMMRGNPKEDRFVQANN